MSYGSDEMTEKEEKGEGKEEREKTITVNGKKLPFYELDTKETFLQKVAVDLNTLPKYLIIETEATEWKVRDLLQEIIKSASTEKDFFSFLKSIEGDISPDSQKIDVKTDVFTVWMAYNTKLKKTDTGELEQFVKAGYFVS